MKEFKLGYGKGYKAFTLDESRMIGELLPNAVQVDTIGVAEVKRAVLHPIGSRRLKDQVKPGDKVVIITSDLTRPMPGKLVVPIVMDELAAGGVRLDDIIVVFAIGSHRCHTEEEGCKFLDKLYKVAIQEKADIVIVSSGGYPKDLNLYQSQKALDNARHAIKPGGIIIWVARSQEGLGESVFEDWITTAKSPEEILERIQVDFQLGGHKAAAIANVLVKAGIFLVSDLDPYLVSKIFMSPFKEIPDALDEAFKRLGDSAKVLIMPVGGSTLPVLKEM